MKMEYLGVRDPGNLDKERLVFRATRSLDTDNLAVFRASASGSDGVTNRVFGCFWFPDHHVDDGELVVLYTKKGSTSEKEVSSGGKTHFLYWQLEKPLWGSAAYLPVLIEISSVDILHEDHTIDQ